MTFALRYCFNSVWVLSIGTKVEKKNFSLLSIEIKPNQMIYKNQQFDPGLVLNFGFMSFWPTLSFKSQISTESIDV